MKISCFSNRLSSFQNIQVSNAVNQPNIKGEQKKKLRKERRGITPLNKSELKRLEKKPLGSRMVMELFRLA